MELEVITTQCCIVGGGPAGIMLGYLLARAGVQVIVLEKYPDFFRDFRGDTIHPSTLEVLAELNLLTAFLKLPHDETKEIGAQIGDKKLIVADFSHLSTICKFIAFIPQWDFLNFLTSYAQAFSSFRILMATEATTLQRDAEGKVIGVIAKNKEKTFQIKADLVVGADGRHSTIRAQSGLAVDTFGAPMDVLWFRLSRQTTDVKQSLGKIDLGNILIMLERGDYWQCGFLIRKGAFDEMKNKGIGYFHDQLAALVPNMKDRLPEIQSWDQIKLLTVTVDRLKQWYLPGLLCIGDAAHAMSPIAGVGINLAIQDAVAAANILIPAFKNNEITPKTLQAVQARREFPTKIIQGIQVFIQNNIIDHVLGKAFKPKVPFVLKLLQWFPILRRIPAFMIGIGVRPEHVKNSGDKIT